jgi:hypothetical protein
VPAVREWLTRGQRATIRGRAELRLAERAATWAARPASRHLPPWWEWAWLRLLTRKRDWTPRQRAMMQRAARHHVIRATALGLVLVLLGLGGWSYLAGLKARDLRDRLLTASTPEVPGIVRAMGPYRARVEPLLRGAYSEAEAGGDAHKQLHASLALLPSDPGQVGYLYRRLLDARPEEFVVIRDQLEPHKGEFTVQLWGELGNEAGDPDRRFRAACALAAYAPDDPGWDRHVGRVAEKLVHEPALALGTWTTAFRPVGDRLLPPLAAMLENANLGAERFRTAADLYLTYADGREERFASLEAWVSERGEATSDEARRRANVAAALAAMGRTKTVWPLLVHTPDPTLRSHLIERLGPGVVDPRLLEARLAAEPDASARRALILALGSFGPARVPAAEPVLLALYEHDSDPGIHGAAGWALRAWGRGESLRRIDEKLATGQVEGNRLWYVNGQHQTLTLVDLPAIGNPPGGGAGYRFAITSREVTVREFQVFRKTHKYNTQRAPRPECPVNMVSWYQAAEYCNWLSKREGIREDQWCYEPNAKGEYAEGMRVKPDYLRLTGYRLPTEAEWVAACRAGARTGWSCGKADEELVGRYAWWLGNSGANGENTTRPVGSLKPNDLGLFDMHGNVSEWCQELGDQPPGVTPVGDRDETGVITDALTRIFRGGSATTQFGIMRADPDARGNLQPHLTPVGTGFRPGRTVH